MRLAGRVLPAIAALSLASGAMAQTGAAPAGPRAYVQPLPPRPALQFDPAGVPDPQRVLALLDYSAAAQMAQLREMPMRLGGGGRGLSSNWISATFLIGLTKLSRVSNAAGSTEFMRQTAEHFNFGLLGGYAPRAMIDADNLAIGALYQELYARSGEAGEIMPLRQRLDYIMPHLMLEPAPEKLVWWWCDALFMAPPVLARASAQTGDPAYLQAMDVQWWRNYDRLWSAEHGLYLRDERFATRTTRNGKPIFWGRGNGWVIAGLVRVLESMPADFPSRPRYVATLRTMAAALVQLQRKEDGLWTTSLLDPLDPSGPESSGSAFYAYALAWGINHGVLDRATYLPHVLRAWSGLAAIVQPNGLLGYAQRTGDQPEPSTASDTALYGTGALLLAGTEVMKLGQPVTAFPIAEPERDPRSTGPLRLPIAYRDPPAGASPEALAAYNRVMAERQAMIDLAYDPRDPKH
jgi:rhamnogalacturonyl hydrolase YesR